MNNMLKVSALMIAALSVSACAVRVSTIPKKADTTVKVAEPKATDRPVFYTNVKKLHSGSEAPDADTINTLEATTKTKQSIVGWYKLPATAPEKLNVNSQAVKSESVEGLKCDVSSFTVKKEWVTFDTDKRILKVTTLDSTGEFFTKKTDDGLLKVTFSGDFTGCSKASASFVVQIPDENED